MSLKLMEEIDAFAAQQADKRLFLNVNAHPYRDGIALSSRYYTMIDGQSYELYGNEMYKTEDSAIDLNTHCVDIGKYEEGKYYPVLSRTISAIELVKSSIDKLSDNYE